MNSKVRCTNCNGYFRRDKAFWKTPNGLQRICTESCFNEWKDRKQPKPRQVKARRALKSPRPIGIPVPLRMLVRRRDGNRCRFCGLEGNQVHHINYRSEGGPDEESNLILLCVGCHERVHSSKKVYKPLLLAYLWMRYVDNQQLFIPEVAKHLDRMGMLSDLQRQRLLR